MPRSFGDDVLALRAASRRLVRAAPALRRLGPHAIASAVAEACTTLGDIRAAPGRALRRELEVRTGLSPAMIAWGLDTSLAAWRADEAVALFEHDRRAAEPSQGEGDPGQQRPAIAPGRPPMLAAVVLAGNVFTAGLRALAFPLVAGVPVLAKASSADDVFPRYFAKALRCAHQYVGRACTVVTFARGDEALDATLLGHAELVSVYGDDDTIAALGAHTPAHARFIAHGHGLGAAYVSADALAGEDTAREAADAVALDVAAYDQRGCLSPHVVIADEGGRVSPARFAELLADFALARYEAELPRGIVPTDALAAQAQWRGVAAARGTLHARAAWAVSFEGVHDVRPGPGYRYVSVYAGGGPESLPGRLMPWGKHLKALGVSGPGSLRARFTSLAPYVCAAGRMQTPPLSAALDGRSPFAGLFARARQD